MTMRSPANRRLALVLALLASPAGGELLVVSAADFHNADGSGHTFTDFSGWIQKGGGSGYLIAPVALPEGAVVTEVSGYLGDSWDDGDFAVELLRKRRGNSVPAEQVARIVSTGIAPAGQVLVTAAAPTHPVVDDLYVYYLSTASDLLDWTTQRLYSILIEYQLALFADGFESGDTSAWGAPPPALSSRWISAASFSPAAKSFDWPWAFDSALGTYSLPNASDSTPPCSIAPLELPHGATIAGFLANLYDVRSDRGLTLSLRRSPINSLVVSAVLAAASTSGSGGWQLRSDLTVVDAVVDNDGFWYYFELCMTGGTTVAAGELAAQAIQVIHSLP
jgi:hypothetical protein